MKKKEKKEITFELRENFNDIVMRELGLDITDNNEVFDIETDSLLSFGDKVLIYPEYEFQRLKPDQMELNFLENSRMFTMLFGMYLDSNAKAQGVEISSVYQSESKRGIKGYMAYTKIENGAIVTVKSKEFFNESVRILNLLCIINRTDHLYDFEMFDIIRTD